MWLSQRRIKPVLPVPPIPRAVSLTMPPLKREYFVEKQLP